ncbi:MAG: mechanosensitive ion channel family protein [Deferrisomatales bacterium]
MLASLLALLLAAAGGLAAHRMGAAILSRWAVRTPFLPDDLVERYWRRPMRLLLPLSAVLLVLPSLTFPETLTEPLRHALSLGFIAAIGWLAVVTASALRDAVLARYDVTVRDNLKARAVSTQLQVVHRVAVTVILVMAIASALLTFDSVRQVGVSLLASAGIVGIILGFAAQKSIATLFAGIQIAVTQPIRLDDVVIVEGEWGRIEEITLTYVVVRIWDLRRLVVPITYFIEKPFQNWTRISADVLGTVFLYADYRVPVEAIRQELHRILQESPEWDGKVWGLQVTDATERTVELRALLSAPDSGTAWNLRCEVREKLLAFLREHCPESLPRVRAEVEEPRRTPSDKGAPGPFGVGGPEPGKPAEVTG